MLAEMFLKKLVGRMDSMENALQRLENMTLEETRMTSAEAFKAIHGVKGMIQGVTDMLQSVDDRVKVIGDKVINSEQTVLLDMPLLSLSIWLGVEKTGRQAENDFDTVTVEDLEGVRDTVDIDEVWSAAKGIKSRSISSDGAQVFRKQYSTILSRLYV